MRTQSIKPAAGFALVLCCLNSFSWLPAQEQPRFTNVRSLTNREIALTLSVSNRVNYQIDTSPNLQEWAPWVTLAATTSSLQVTDSAAPYLNQRLYRAQRLSATNVLTGDHLATADGDVVIHAVSHASFVMSWNGKMIYNDPTDGASPYQSFPRADLILVSHDHGDHFSSSTIDAVRGSNALIVVPGYVYTNGLSAAQKTRAVVLANGASINVMGLTIDAIPAYNSNHPLGRGNGYVLTIGGKRLYMSGDTGNIAEMRALTNIDVAFVCMNVPFTMTINEATNAVRAFRPQIVYPYHYRDQNGTLTNASAFKQRLGTDAGVEVRLRKWY
jgi:L-ascorbate metabolism protein UlaG (beta-lactamase superfamily)